MVERLSHAVVPLLIVVFVSTICEESLVGFFLNFTVQLIEAIADTCCTVLHLLHLALQQLVEGGHQCLAAISTIVYFGLLLRLGLCCRRLFHCSFSLGLFFGFNISHYGFSLCLDRRSLFCFLLLFLHFGGGIWVTHFDVFVLYCEVFGVEIGLFHDGNFCLELLLQQSVAG